jgi:hypothetical protein
MLLLMTPVCATFSVAETLPLSCRQNVKSSGKPSFRTSFSCAERTIFKTSVSRRQCASWFGCMYTCTPMHLGIADGVGIRCRATKQLSVLCVLRQCEVPCECVLIKCAVTGEQKVLGQPLRPHQAGGSGLRACIQAESRHAVGVRFRGGIGFSARASNCAATLQGVFQGLAWPICHTQYTVHLQRTCSSWKPRTPTWCCACSTTRRAA